MANPGSYRIQSRSRALDDYLDPALRSARRVQRIVDSLRMEIESGNCDVRVRRILDRPREIFRVEIETPELGYQRTTLLDRDALDELLEADQVRARVRISA